MNKVFIIFKYVILICIFAVSTNTYSQKVYSGNSSYQSDIFCTVSNGYIYIGNSTYQSDIIAYFDGKYLYKGKLNEITAFHLKIFVRYYINIFKW